MVVMGFHHQVLTIHGQGEIHFYSEVCGLTYFLLPLLRHRTH